MLHITDGHEELVRRLRPEDVVPWFEARRRAHDADVRVFQNWLVMQPVGVAEEVLRDLQDRFNVLRALLASVDNSDDRRAVTADGRYVLGSGLIRTLLCNGELAIDPLDMHLIHVDSVDLRVGTVAWSQIASDAPIRAAALTREDFCRLHRPIALSETSLLVLPPNGFVDVQTLENVRLPSGYAARVENVSGRARLGLLVALAQHVHAGHTGPIVMEFKNVGQFTLTFEPGDVVAQLVLERVEGAAEPYGENGIPYSARNGHCATSGLQDARTSERRSA